jgi:DNA-binding MarR family transcriptional regulator
MLRQSRHRQLPLSAFAIQCRPGEYPQADVLPEEGWRLANEESGPDWIDSETKVAEAPADHGDDLRLWLRLLTCSTLVETEVRRRLREEFDFTLPRFDLLAQLERADEGMVLGEISKRMMVSAGNLTALVERLVESGHIKRTTSPSDRRVQIITLTDFGRGAFRKMADRHGEWIGALFKHLSSRDRAALIKELAKLKSSIRASLAENA